MKMNHLLNVVALSFAVSLMSACTVDKLEARLQADPQCKAVTNPKTGALMPCPGTDKEFYKSVPALNATSPKVSPVTEGQLAPVTATSVPTPISTPTPKTTVAPVGCKPQLHQKSGSLMPCPAP